MKQVKIFFIFILVVFLAAGCGTKRETFEPKKIVAEIEYDGELPSAIVDVARDGATLENGQIITKDGLSSVVLPRGYMFVNGSKDRFIATSRCGELVVVDQDSKIVFKHKFDSMVASASIKGNLLAIVLGNNKLVLLDIDNSKILFEKDGDSIYAVDSKVASPYFFTTLLVYPTLDGKLIIVDLKTNKVLRDVVVKSEKFFSNVIFLDVIDNRLVAATKKRVVSITPKSMAFLDEDIKDVIILKDRVLIFTKDGKILLTNADLKVLKTKKYKFASFVGTIHGKFIYVVEKAGYLIATDIDLISSNVYELPNEIEDKVFTTNDKLYYEKYFFKLEKTRSVDN